MNSSGELQRGDQITLGILPAQQRLSAGYQIRFDLDLWLVVQAKLAFIKGAPKRPFRLDPVCTLPTHPEVPVKTASLIASVVPSLDWS